MRYAKIPKLCDLMKKLSDDQLVDFAEKTVKEGDDCRGRDYRVQRDAGKVLAMARHDNADQSAGCWGGGW